MADQAIRTSSKVWVSSEGELTLRGRGDLTIDEFEGEVKALVPDYRERGRSVIFDHHEQQWLARLGPKH
jgi:hypothetical protein